MTAELDLSRLDRVAELLDTSVPEIVADILEKLTAGIEALDGQLDPDDLEGTAKAAHACRNEALLVSAQPLLHALTALEHAAREEHLADVRAAQVTLAEVWPATRQALAAVAARRD